MVPGQPRPQCAGVRDDQLVQFRFPHVGRLDTIEVRFCPDPDVVALRVFPTRFVISVRVVTRGSVHGRNHHAPPRPW
ncbi:hypothetical protein Acsp01_47210 [Actinoplanes sp. NBRC 101535]|nr:hypothetical protein Acsp01_47210 [Actinoplanes sp. NBRC 101535]